MKLVKSVKGILGFRLDLHGFVPFMLKALVSTSVICKRARSQLRISKSLHMNLMRFTVNALV
jgi:hypothetical protein